MVAYGRSVKSRLLVLAVIVLFVAGVIPTLGCSGDVARDGAPAGVAESQPELTVSMLDVAGDRLDGEMQGGGTFEGPRMAPGNPPGGATGGTSEEADEDELDLESVLGEWWFADRSGGVAFHEELSMTLFDTEGWEGGPYEVSERDGALYVLLGPAEIEEVFGEGLEVEAVSFTFVQQTDDELEMIVTNEDTQESQSLLLTRGDDDPIDPIEDEDDQVRANVDLLAEACLYYAYYYGEMPTVSDVDPDGAIAELLTEWPTNPFTGEPMEYVSRQQKIGNYEVSSVPSSTLGMFARQIIGYLSDGSAYEVEVAYEQLGM